VSETLTPTVFLAVLAAAAMHAGWNAVLKMTLEPLMAMALVAIGSTVVALPLLVLLGLPDPRSWPWLLGSVAVHVGYYTALAEAYRRADMGQVYPVARGAAPLLTALVSGQVLAEQLSGRASLGIVLLAGGVALMSLLGRRRGAAFDRNALAFAVLTAATITGYSICDGLGARAAGDPHAYSAALFVVNSLPISLIVLWRRGAGPLWQLRKYFLRGLAAGAMSLGSYWIAIWAMTRAPIAIVAALRESSVLFASLIAVIVLKEPLLAVRGIAALLIVAGLALLRWP
jgi:drug/metabolite transporter (DMT)-like permease